MGIEEAVLTRLTRVFDIFGIHENVGVSYRTAAMPFDALLATRGPARIIIDKTRDESRKFALCRGVFEYLTAGAREYAAVTGVRSERQQRNRAFAAEFLVPAGQLKERVCSETVTEDDLEVISEEFGVSAYVVRHQLENHRLATVRD